LDVRLSIDLKVQKYADQLLTNNKGAIVAINAKTGEILVMASHPTYNPNLLADEMSSLSDDINSPLINRAIQGSYPIQNLLSFFYQSLLTGKEDSQPDVQILNNLLGFYSSSLREFPKLSHSDPSEPLLVNPVQVALDAASYSNLGIRPIPRLTLEVNVPGKGWISITSSENADRLFSSAIAYTETNSMAEENGISWGINDQVFQKGMVTSWSIGGTLPNWNGTPVAIVVLLENMQVQAANEIRDLLLMQIINYSN
jgi:hypothetical protein